MDGYYLCVRAMEIHRFVAEAKVLLVSCGVTFTAGYSVSSGYGLLLLLIAYWLILLTGRRVALRLHSAMLRHYT